MRALPTPLDPAPGAATVAPLPAAAAGALVWLIGALFALQPLSTDLYLPTLPSIAREFGAGVATVQSTLALFIGTFGVAQLVAGPLSDRYGRRPLIVGGALLFTLGSLVCLAAPAIGVLLLGRVLQAAGACASIVAARAVARDQFEPRAGARALAKAGSIMGFAVVLGPLCGALLARALGWRAAFALLAAIGALTTAHTGWRLAETNRLRDRAALGAAHLAATYRAIARNPAFRAFALANTLSYAGLFTFLSSAPFVLIRILGMSPIECALGLAFTGSGYVAGTFVCRRLMGGRGLAATLGIGALLQCGAGLALLLPALAGVPPGIALVLLPMIVYCGGHGIVQPVAQAGCIAPFPRHAGAAAALMGCGIQVSAAAVGIVVGASWNGTTRPLALMIAAAGSATLLLAAPLARRHGAEH